MSPIVPPCAFAVSADGTAVPLDGLPASDAAPDSAYVWTHLHVHQAGGRDWLTKEARLEARVVSALMAVETRPRILITEAGFMIILRAMNLHEGEDPEEMISLRMWIDDRRVITTRLRDIKAVEEIQASMTAGESPVSPDEFLRRITSRMFARMEPFLEDLEDNVAALEGQVTSEPDSDLCSNTSMIRKRVAIFRRYITPQKAVLQKLHEHPISCVCSEQQRNFGEELDRVTRYGEELDELSARMQILNEELRNRHAERLNDLAYLFSIVATIFLPLGFLTGLLGVNIGGIPAQQNPYAFWSFSGLCVLLIGVQLLMFRRLKWF
jgi:zinc transporter